MNETLEFIINIISLIPIEIAVIWAIIKIAKGNIEVKQAIIEEKRRKNV